jgi:LysR family transcriptional regulator, transcriptional activator of nhaA
VARAGGLKQAGRSLHVSPPTLSAQIRALEESLGAPLFLRDGRKMVLSDTGRVVRRYAERIFELGDEMAEVVDRGEPAGPGTVHLGIVDGVPKPLATDIVRRAWEKVPSLRLVAREGLPGELFPALAAHQIDIVISNEAPFGQLGTILSSRRVACFKVHFAAAAGMTASRRRAHQLDKLPLLLPTRESPLRRELDRWFADHGIHPEVRAEFDDTAAMYELAASGLGAVPVPAPMLGHVQKRYGLRDLRVNTGIEEELFVVTAERQFTHEGPRLLAALAREIFAPRAKSRTARS